MSSTTTILDLITFSLFFLTQKNILLSWEKSEKKSLINKSKRENLMTGKQSWISSNEYDSLAIRHFLHKNVHY